MDRKTSKNSDRTAAFIDDSVISKYLEGQTKGNQLAEIIEKSKKSNVPMDFFTSPSCILAAIRRADQKLITVQRIIDITNLIIMVYPGLVDGKGVLLEARFNDRNALINEVILCANALTEGGYFKREDFNLLVGRKKK